MRWETKRGEVLEGVILKRASCGVVYVEAEVNGEKQTFSPFRNRLVLVRPAPPKDA